MEKKYKLTEETINISGRTLYRIEALKDFGDVKKGDKGGYIEREDNLTQSGNCWVYDAGKVYGKAYVHNDARVYDNAKVCGNARLSNNAAVYDNALVYGNARICDNALVYCKAEVCDNASVYCNGEIYGNAVVYGNAEIYDNAKVYDYAVIYDKAKVYDNAIVCDIAKVYGNAEIYDNAVIINNSDYIVFKNWWSSGRYFTWTRSNNMWKVGCFYGTGEQLIEKAYKDSEKSGREYERIVKYVESSIVDDTVDA